jgi:hypothetical protein
MLIELEGHVLFAIKDKNTTTGKYRSSVRGTHSFIDYFD